MADLGYCGVADRCIRRLVLPVVLRKGAAVEQHQSAKPAKTKNRLGAGPGRSASEAQVRRIVEAAARLFVEKGYAGASMQRIASVAGTGKPTIYRRFGSKEALFLAVIDSEVQQLAEVARFEEARGSNPAEALKQSCRFFLDFMLSPDMIRLQRILVSEAARFPNIGAYMDNCMAPFTGVMQRLLWSATVSGRFRNLGPEKLELYLNGAIVGWPVRQAMLGLEPFDGPQAREVYFEMAWDLFLRGAG